MVYVHDVVCVHGVMRDIVCGMLCVCVCVRTGTHTRARASSLPNLVFLDSLSH